MEGGLTLPFFLVGMSDELRAIIIILIVFLMFLLDMCSDYDNKRLYEEEKIEQDSSKKEKIAILRY
jgi:hypothetical protein